MADDLASVLVVLSALKRERVPFADAWAIACPSSRPDRERVALRQALDATAEAWERYAHRDSVFRDDEARPN